MEQIYFNENHFKLLKEWQKKSYEKNTADHRRIYAELKDAYAITKKWAESLQGKHFPNGVVDCRLSPINQGQFFESYLWAKIYPGRGTTEKLAFTVSINANYEFVVKIDLVRAKFKGGEYKKIKDELARVCEAIGPSPIVAVKSAAEGLALDFDALVNWSIESIKNFKITYDELADRLGLSAEVENVPNSKATTDDDEENRSGDARTSGKNPRNFIYYGPPGTGKTFKLQELIRDKYEEGCCVFVTFHQSYGYEEFVEGLRPVVGDGNDTNGEVRYAIKEGRFLELCNRARLDPSRRYAIVIDEINRGNISKIFGELITLLEVDKREGLVGAVSVELAYSGRKFSVPANVDVIGTMNTADRSLALMDTALRRRFEFIEAMPDPSVLAGKIISHDGVDINIENMLIKINKRIEALYDRDHTIGHAYFTDIKAFNELKDTFSTKIIPLLQEYFFDDWQKIRLVLGDNQKLEKDHFVHEIGQEEDLLELFGREHELDQYGPRTRYQLNAAALDRANAYLGIYAGKPEVIAE